jgi:Uma2 family endonuclease
VPDEDEFASFVAQATPRLRRAFVACRGISGAADATAEALAYAWEHWPRVRVMENPVGYLYRVGQSRTRARRSLALPAPAQRARAVTAGRYGLRVAMTEVDGAVLASAMTAEAYLAIPEGDRHYWLVDGDLVVNAPSYDHQRLVVELVTRLRAWTAADPARGTALISVDAQLDDANVYQPDVWWIAASHSDRLVDGRLVGAPDLAVEVLSPSTQHFDRGVKLRAYERNGCRELWLVDGGRGEVSVRRRWTTSASGFDVRLDLGPADVLSTPLLPGFSVDLSDLFTE